MFIGNIILILDCNTYIVNYIFLVTQFLFASGENCFESLGGSYFYSGLLEVHTSHLIPKQAKNGWSLKEF